MAALFNSSNKTIPCRSGKCTTPIEVTCFQLIISEVFPKFVAKVLLYPGALASAIMKGKTIPSYSSCRKLFVCCRSLNWSSEDEPHWDTSSALGPCKRSDDVQDLFASASYRTRYDFILFHY
ncbi:hypothetical protein WN944_022291 [Citrus x changshan-huyou]|uniref:Uncharacterized protein n=1 Tax=Citrus x changshan-huyou TaxID=2935761 RepID=A0AAP0N445_9ROSI